MSLLEAIKGPKTMSFKHWRYRLLHWCFNVNPSCPGDSDLPQFMYSHYCPLFHVTNLIALFSPFILLVRVLLFLIGALFNGIAFVAVPFGQGCANLWRMLIEFLPERKEQEPQPVPELSDHQKWAEDIVLMKKTLQQSQRAEQDFDYLWREMSYKFLIMTEEEAHQVHKEFVHIIETARRRRAEREAAMRAWFATMANVSQFVIKCLLYVIYAGLAVALAAGIYYGTMPFIGLCGSVCSAIGTFFSDVFVWMKETMTAELLTTVLVWGGSIAAAITVLTLFCLAGAKLRVGQLMLRGTVSTVQFVSPPFVFTGWLLSLPFRGIVAVVKGFGEFVSVFYEENCPPITIVNDEKE